MEKLSVVIYPQNASNLTKTRKPKSQAQHTLNSPHRINNKSQNQLPHPLLPPHPLPRLHAPPPHRALRPRPHPAARPSLPARLPGHAPGHVGRARRRPVPHRLPAHGKVRRADRVAETGGPGRGAHDVRGRAGCAAGFVGGAVHGQEGV